MASGITHILLMKNLQTIMPGSRLKMILASGRDFLQVGAVGPDLPYASILDDDLFFSTQSDMADNFHYRKTNQVPLKALEEIKGNKAGYSDDELKFMFNFFLGFISHIVADGIIHPFIRDKVGDYLEHQSAHRQLEMQLDVLFFHYLTKFSGHPIDLNYSNIHEEIKNLYVGFYPEADSVIDLFRAKIEQVYGVKYERDLIYSWMRGLHRMWGAAEGNHPAIYKEISFIKTFIFSDYADLISKADEFLTLTIPVDRDENFLHKEKVHFFNDCIPRFNNIFIPLAEKCYDYIYGSGTQITEADIYPIDLDTGRELSENNNLDLIPSYWS